LLDEPRRSGSAARIEIRNLLKKLGRIEKTVIVEPHPAELATSVPGRDDEKGNLIIDGYVDEVMRKADSK